LDIFGKALGLFWFSNLESLRNRFKTVSRRGQKYPVVWERAHTKKPGGAIACAARPSKRSLKEATLFEKVSLRYSIRSNLIPPRSSSW
jgi:hypothetical protein